MVYKSDLADQILQPERAGEFLYCPACGTEASANAGDYWYLADDYKFQCKDGHRAANMVLATKSTTVEVIK